MKGDYSLKKDRGRTIRSGRPLKWFERKKNIGGQRMPCVRLWGTGGEVVPHFSPRRKVGTLFFRVEVNWEGTVVGVGSEERRGKERKLPAPGNSAGEKHLESTVYQKTLRYKGGR